MELADKNLMAVFKDKLTQGMIDALNYRKQNNYTQIQHGIASLTELEQIRKGIKYCIQGVIAQILHILAKVEYKPQGNDNSDIDKFAKYLNINIIVYDSKTLKRNMKLLNLIQKNQKIKLKFILYIYYTQRLYGISHFDYLTRLTEAFEEKKVKKNYALCNICESTTINHYELPDRINLICEHCFRWFPVQECYDNHIKSNACNTIWKCQICKRNIKFKQRKPDEHKCNEYKCFNCKEWVFIRNLHINVI